MDALEFLLLTACVAAVAWSRIYLGYHDGYQVCAGTAHERNALLHACSTGQALRLSPHCNDLGLAAGFATAVVWRRVVERGWVRGVLQYACHSFPGARHQHSE